MALTELSSINKGIIGAVALGVGAIVLPLPKNSEISSLDSATKATSVTPLKSSSLCFDDERPRFTYHEPNAKTGSLTIEFENMEDASQGRITADLNLKRLQGIEGIQAPTTLNQVKSDPYPHVDLPDFRRSKLGIYLEAAIEKVSIIPMLALRIMIGKTNEDSPRDTYESSIPLFYKEHSPNRIIACWDDFGNLEVFSTYPNNQIR